jgi:hypothetical protein
MAAKMSATLPGTLQRSPAKAQRTYTKTLENAEAEYGPGERASRTAYSSLKHSFKKVDDHWEEKARKGPSDPQAALSGAAARRGEGESFGGVDALGESREALYRQAQQLQVPGRASMNKTELARAIAKKQR